VPEIYDGYAIFSETMCKLKGQAFLNILFSGEKLLKIQSKLSKMKTNLLFVFVFLGQLLSAQTFTEAINTPFSGVRNGSIAFSDIDGDNDQDVLITGRNSSNEPTSKLYINDGAGHFTEVMNTPFDASRYGSIAFSDIDGDNDQDVLITGSNASFDKISKLYTNDGLGNFTEVTDAPFEGIYSGSVAFSDVDGDNDQDVLIIGLDLMGVSKLYTNDGSGNFTEVTGTPFEVLNFTSIAFSDIDGDDDQDVLITGQYGPNARTTKLYTNDGVGNFTEVMDTPFEDVYLSSVAFADLDGDSDQDLLITGYDGSNEVAKLYINDGMGNFTEMTNTPFDSVRESSIAFSDVDGDNDQDLLITGHNGSTEIAKLYINGSIVSLSEIPITQLNFQFILYPNPTKANSINVSYNSIENGLISVNIFDMKGKLLKQHKELAAIGEQNISMSISSLSKGYYIIQLDDGKRQGAHRFFVE